MSLALAKSMQTALSSQFLDIELYEWVRCLGVTTWGAVAKIF